MPVQQHLESLAERHRKLDDLISEELTHPFYDTSRIAELKRRKLKLKEEIERLRH